jgi:hypothetical protein
MQFLFEKDRSVHFVRVIFIQMYHLCDLHVIHTCFIRFLVYVSQLHAGWAKLCSFEGLEDELDGSLQAHSRLVLKVGAPSTQHMWPASKWRMICACDEYSV